MSLRARLTLAAAAVISIGMIVAAGILLWRMHSVLATDLDNSLIQQSHAAAEDLAGGDMSPRISNTAGASTALQVVDSTGRVIDSAGDVDGVGRMFFTVPTASEPSLTTIEGPGLEGPHRVAATTVATPAGSVTLYLASPTAPLATIRHELGTSLALGIPATILALTTVSWWLIGRALRPVETMRKQAASIPGHDSARRLDVPVAGDELGRLAETFNDLLARIAAASETQRRFVDDAAHELRNPLAALRTRLEVDDRTGAGPRTDATSTGALAAVQRLTDLVDDLLVTARLDGGTNVRERQVDLDDLVWQNVIDVRRQCTSPTIDATGVAPVRVLGDPSALYRAVRNLFDNARRHARSRITVRLALNSMDPSAECTATLTITDDGPGIDPADRSRIFDRFVRLDEGRTRDDGGTGLGLAIVASVVGAHHGSVWVQDGAPGATFVMRLPATAP